MESVDIDEQVARAVDLLADRRTAVLTGAGISADSGIPTYRGAAGVPRRPMTVQDFLSGDAARRRYWMGGHLGWRRFSAVHPNAGHRALAELERAGAVTGVMTQNVDGLHLQAGSQRVIELHGTGRRVYCLQCGQVFDRESVAAQIDARNPWLAAADDIPLGPDGDVVPEATDGFLVPVCTVCGGMLKPDVVFFGETIPLSRFRTAESLLRASDALLIAGTSLVVNSGVRFAERARRRDLPIVIVNHEPTRVDTWAALTIAAGTSEVLPAMARALTSSTPAALGRVEE